MAVILSRPHCEDGSFSKKTERVYPIKRLIFCGRACQNIRIKTLRRELEEK